VGSLPSAKITEFLCTEKLPLLAHWPAKGIKISPWVWVEVLGLSSPGLLSRNTFIDVTHEEFAAEEFAAHPTRTLIAIVCGSSAASPFRRRNFYPSVAVEPIGRARKNEHVMLNRWCRLCSTKMKIAMAEAKFCFSSCTDRGTAPCLGCWTPPPPHSLGLFEICNQDDVWVTIAPHAGGGPTSAVDPTSKRELWPREIVGDERARSNTVEVNSNFEPSSLRRSCRGRRLVAARRDDYSPCPSSTGWIVTGAPTATPR